MGIRRLRAYPPAVRPLAVWGWGEDLNLPQVEHALERLTRLGFGGVVVAPRGIGGMKQFLSPLWLQCLEAAERAAAAAGVEMWCEAPLRGFLKNGLLPLSDLGRQIWLEPSPWETCPSHAILALYRRDPSGRIRHIAGGEPAKMRSSAHLALCTARLDSPDFFEPSVAARYAAKVLEAHHALFPLENRQSSFRGFFLGSPLPCQGELWNENLAHALEEQGFADFFGRAPDLFGEVTGGEPAFVHHYRFIAARTIQQNFAEPLVAWSRERQIALVAPQESGREEAIPAWAFQEAGMQRAVQARVLGTGSGCERMVSNNPGIAPFVMVGNETLKPGLIGTSAFSQAAEIYLSCSGGRAVVDWIPFADETPLEWAEDPCSLALTLPKLRGLRETNMRMASWTLIGGTARRNPRILVITPQTSYWRLPQNACAVDPSERERTRHHEQTRLQSLLLRVENCLRTMSFDYGTWHECSEIPDGLQPHLGTARRYDLVILPGLLNLQPRTWMALADFAMDGGKIAALERYPAFVDGSASEDLTNWARSTIERCETIDHLTACLQDCVERPVRAISLTRAYEPHAPEVVGLEEDGRCAWIIARNSNPTNAVRGLVETSCTEDEFADEVDLETGSLNAAPSVVRLDSMLSLEVDLAPGQTRLFRLQKAPLAEVDGLLVDAAPRFAEIVLGSDWLVRPSDQNLFPLTWMEYALPGLPWMGPEHAGQLHEALARQLSLAGVAGVGEVLLKMTFEIEQAVSLGLADLLDLALYYHPRTQLRALEFNGIGAQMLEATSCTRTGLKRLSLPTTARQGTNELVLRIAVDAADSVAPVMPWILGGRFGVVPSHQYIQDQDDLVHAPGGYRLMACPGSSERLTDAVSTELNLIDGIETFISGSEDVRRSWMEWEGWPLLRERRALHEAGMPFYGGMIKLEGTFALPSPGPIMGPWKTAVFELGPTQASWAALKVNGVSAGSLGLPPYRRDITSMLDPSGRNKISLRVWFSWSDALAPFRGVQHRPSPELRVMRRGFLSLPKILLMG